MGPLLLSRVLELNDVQEGVFFFSSRRRHTRCGHDWSSDVCSSDLVFGCGTRDLHRSPAATAKNTAHRATSSGCANLQTVRDLFSVFQWASKDRILVEGRPLTALQFF